ncbi:MAG: hypothetical protein COZ34_04085 [Candidatus Pacebacteria bacterium CG_4_10_14_3_um_filter_34_15]|nr:hypothetical protein [Candidatus Pacearchaeota archaeon]NCQ65746.1 hypothetical protein [Candidatus Paceibacterota bacterium]OIO45100.1 MAG: hypothetical protein AUJ41_00880 [Candidatus Pacebacteria bacterium CG1_02_43_31]PIQ80842.1 MAG: hypothetical protein COV78_03425 [Candidatus Pacebacteria bacterium CG11_big_fil_rev_8_21_14_0_20_34_55]PIX81290.1 MAG: hypothetical protein COZ34_04085 [Candidatus Pacebacteria bacterium CG_4_10_14_3_um_filter_34_15]PJC44122.1 MAG: hypothetical protein CO0
MDLPELAFFLLGVFIFIIFIYGMWTKSGRKQTIEMTLGLKVVGEPLDLPSDEIKPKFGFTIKQDLKLYKCLNGINDVYVLENTQRAFGGIQRNWVKLSIESLDRLNEIRSM